MMHSEADKAFKVNAHSIVPAAIFVLIFLLSFFEKWDYERTEDRVRSMYASCWRAAISQLHLGGTCLRLSFQQDKYQSSMAIFIPVIFWRSHLRSDHRVSRRAQPRSVLVVSTCGTREGLLVCGVSRQRSLVRQLSGSAAATAHA